MIMIMAYHNSEQVYEKGWTSIYWLLMCTLSVNRPVDLFINKDKGLAYLYAWTNHYTVQKISWKWSVVRVLKGQTLIKHDLYAYCRAKTNSCQCKAWRHRSRSDDNAKKLFFCISAFWIPCFGRAWWKISTAQIWWKSVHRDPEIWLHEYLISPIEIS